MKYRFIFEIVVLLLFQTLFSCSRPAYQRYITFNVDEVVLNDYYDETYQACEHIRGNTRGKKRKVIGGPGVKKLVNIHEDYDFYLDMGNLGEFWCAVDPQSENNKVLRIHNNTFRIVDVSEKDDKIRLKVSTSYNCVFELDKTIPGETDMVEKIEFCLNPDETDDEYRYPLEMYFNKASTLSFRQAVEKSLIFRVYLKPGDGYDIERVVVAHGSDADKALDIKNNYIDDGFYEFEIEPVRNLNSEFSANPRTVTISTLFSST